MLQVIEKLLILQDRDRQLLNVQDELARIGPERQALQARQVSSQANLEAAKQKVKHLESERKKLELEVDAKKQLIEGTHCNSFKPRRTRNTAPWPTRSKPARQR